MLADDTFGQADLTFILTPDTIDIDQTSYTYSVVNRGNISSDRFRIKVWVSADAVIDETDLNSLSTVLSELSPDNNTNSPRETHSIAFKFPLPELDNRPEPRLTNDSLTASQWIGRNMHARACIMDEFGEVEIECSAISSDTAQVLPPRSLSFLGNGSYGAPQVTSGISTEVIELSWLVPPTDNGNLLIDEYRVTEEAFDGSTTQISAMVSDMTVFTGDDGLDRYRLELRGRERGKQYAYDNSLQTCLNNLCSTPTFGLEFGNTLADFSATTDQSLRVTLDWDIFATTNVRGYYVVRCDFDNPDDCEEIATLIAGTSFVDQPVARGEKYIYYIDVCIVFLDCDISRARYRMGITNPGTSGLVDDFEDDDTPAQATIVDRSVSQLRSFDTPTDEDWIEVVVSSAQSITFRTSGETSEDTQLTLFGETGTNQIDFSSNTPGVPTSFATLITEELDPGTYFLKVNQGFIPGLPPQEVFNYTLDIEMSNQSIVIAPIINLLLDE